MAQQTASTPAKTAAASPQSTSTGPKILRIGVIQNGRIVEERLIRRREDITVGQSAKNTFVLPASTALSKAFTLFQITPSGYALNFSDGMDGRIAFDQNVAPTTLTQLRAKAQKKGDFYHAPLSEKARGKIVIGDVTLLFQFVAPPPVQPRPQLPPSVRGSITQNLDWLMVAIIGLSFFGHIGFVLYLRSVDWPRKPDIEEIPDRFVSAIIPKQEIKKPEVARVDPNKGNTKEKDPSDAPKKKSSPVDIAVGSDKPRAGTPIRPAIDPETAARAEAERKAKLAEEIGNKGVLKLIGAKGGDENSSIANLLKGGGADGDADKVFGKIGGVGVAGAGTGGGGLHSLKNVSGPGGVKTIGDLRASGPGTVESGQRVGEREAPKGMIKEEKVLDVDGTLDPNVVANEIRKRKGALVACYEHALKRNPSLSGKVQLRFTVSTVGKVTGADIENDTLHDDDVARCMISTIKGWRFPAPAGGEAQFSYPFVFQAAK